MAKFDRDKVIPALDIGPGWTVLEVSRKKGNHIDKYWFSPVKKHRFRSKPEIGRFKAALEAAPGNDEDAAWSIFKGNDGSGRAKASPGKKRKSSSTAAVSSAAASSSTRGGSVKKKKKKSKETLSPKSDSGDGGAEAVDMSGADAGAGHPFPSTNSSSASKSASAAEAVKAQPTKSVKQVTSRKVLGTGMASTRGYIPNVDLKTHDPDGPYVDEDEITRVYNFPKGGSGAEDGVVAPEIDAKGDVNLEGIDEGGTPYRHITNWFLARPGGVHRMELPAQARFVNKQGICLYGELLPSPKKVSKALSRGKKPPSNQPVVIRRGLLWSIDRDHVDRGIWFGTKDAWYKLEQPCTAKVYNGKSQEDLHVKLRAKFGLVSNLLDMFTESSKALNLESFYGLHACRSPLESHSLLSPSRQGLAENPELVAEPFDLELLKREAKFVSDHLSGCHEDLTETCMFIKGLAAMEKEWKASGKASAEDTFDYLASAKAAEARAGRLPWGSLSFQKDEESTGLPRINLLIEIKVARSRSPQKSRKSKSEAATTVEEERPRQEKWAAAVALGSQAGLLAKKEVKTKAKATAPSRSVKVSSKAPKSPRGLPKDSFTGKVGALKTQCSEDSMFSTSDSDRDDEWRPSGATISQTSESLGAKSSMQPPQIRVLDTKLYPILIDEVKRGCNGKIKPFTDALARVYETRADAFISSFVTTDTVASYEFMLVVVECLRVSSASVLRQLFYEKKPGTAACRYIFISWLDAAKARMKERRSTGAEQSILKAVQASLKTEEELAFAILRLARECFGPNTGQYPDSVSRKLHLDIIAIVKQVMRTQFSVCAALIYRFLPGTWFSCSRPFYRCQYSFVASFPTSSKNSPSITILAS